MSSTGQGTDLASIVGANIRSLREAGRLTQTELGRLVSKRTSGQQISDWERGAYRPSDTSLLELARIFDRPFGWFFMEHTADEAAR